MTRSQTTAPRVPDLLDIPLFRTVPPRAAAALEAELRVVSAEAGEKIVRKGELADEFFVILDGDASVGPLHGHHRSRRLSPGMFFGEIGLIGEPVRTATVTAETSIALAALDRRTFRALLRQSPTAATIVLDAYRARSHGSRNLLEPEASNGRVALTRRDSRSSAHSQRARWASPSAAGRLEASSGDPDR